MDLNIIAKEIRDLLDDNRKENSITFVEETHKYTMKDINGVIRSDFPSVSKIIKKFYPPFDAEGMALRKTKGDPEETKKLLAEWKLKGDNSTNLGSRVHFELESELIRQYNNYKEVRQPIYECNEEQLLISDNMINAGKDFINIMHERGAVLLDSEAILGDKDLEYFGTPDNLWLIKNNNNEIGICVSDWKSNQPKNFETQWFTKQMKQPFAHLPDTAKSHYFLQLPLYGRLLLKMLQGTKYENMKLLGGIVVLLKDNGKFQEYRVPMDIIKTILNMDLTTIK